MTYSDLHEGTLRSQPAPEGLRNSSFINNKSLVEQGRDRKEMSSAAVSSSPFTVARLNR